MVWIERLFWEEEVLVVVQICKGDKPPQARWFPGGLFSVVLGGAGQRCVGYL